MARLEITVEGLNPGAWEELPDQLNEAVRAETRDLADAIFFDSQLLVPVAAIRGGTLRDSGSVVPTEDSINIGYNTPYAIYVHQRSELWHLPPTRDHFLTIPLFEKLPMFAAKLEARIRATLERAFK
jgi:hypothetical protein